MVSVLAEFLVTYGLARPNENCANDTTIINALLKESYNKHYIPSHPTHVRVDMWVQEVTAVSELTQDFEIDLYINEFWEDPALVFDFMNPCKSNFSFDDKDPALVFDFMNPCKSNFSFDDKVLQKLWIPNTCFINSKNAAIHESPFKYDLLLILLKKENKPAHTLFLQSNCVRPQPRFANSTFTFITAILIAAYYKQ
ncbi:unnamed protein product [Strongylus vulgaris]|uniref:Neurotransmitter-gated ion-channel ligand-binding domain-containing protein n=1 Tax=Strongylus vulgaris TaxID=40348 RepID=A0A3P7JIJ2_STRVU|nr:unnamed protein product [Strongylus vulgaris]